MDLARQTEVVGRIRTDLETMTGSRIRVRANMGRSKIVEREGIGRDRFEFQMLYGVRRDLQRLLVARGYTVRIYVPYGQEWYPYFMRRLAERPANVGFMLRALVKEEGRRLRGH